METIELYEDNAGGLTVWDTERGYGWTGLQTADEGTFADHAAAMALGDDSLWLMDRVSSPAGELVATWTDGAVEIVGNAGAAAARFLAPRPRPYTWIIADGFDPGATLTARERAAWIDAAEVYIAENQGHGLDIRVRAALPGDAEGLYRGHYPETHGFAGLDDEAATAATDAAFQHAWGAAPRG